MPAISPNKPYRVGRSRTGLGLFATKPIKKGTKIVRYFGPLLDSRKKKDDAIENKYLFELSGRWTIDGSVRKNVARYINHACKPNAESDVKPRKRKVVIRAIKNIEPGEEINYDYGTDYFKAYLKPIGCKCDACERKRRKKRAEARAERLRLKAKAENKALKKAEKQAEKASRKLQGMNGAKPNGKHANGGRPRVGPGRRRRPFDEGERGPGGAGGAVLRMIGFRAQVQDGMQMMHPGKSDGFIMPRPRTCGRPGGTGPCRSVMITVPPAAHQRGEVRHRLPALLRHQDASRPR